jgi:hypothetical protein
MGGSGNASPPFGPWNPGIESEIPDAIRHLSTFLRPENVFTSPSAARELRDFTGLDLPDVVAFRPERLALHELLIRVTADLSVPDGVRIEDLGINFRHITRTVLAHRIAPRMAFVVACYDRVRRDMATLIERECDRLFDASSDAPKVKRGPFAFLSKGARTRLCTMRPAAAKRGSPPSGTRRRMQPPIRCRPAPITRWRACSLRCSCAMAAPGEAAN